MQKICFVASSGGHLEEISRLPEVRDKYLSFLVTEKTEFAELDFCQKVYHLPQINRKEITFLFKFLWIFIQSYRIMKKENPPWQKILYK